MVALAAGQPFADVSHDSLVGEEVAHKLPPVHADAHGPFIPLAGTGTTTQRKHPLESWAGDK